MSCRGDLAVLWFESHRKWSNKETTKIKSPTAVVAESLANGTFLLGCDVRAVSTLEFAVVQIEIRSVGGQTLQGWVWKALDPKLQEILLRWNKVSKGSLWVNNCLGHGHAHCWKTRCPQADKELRPALSGRMPSFAKCSSPDYSLYAQNEIHSVWDLFR